MVDLKQTFSFYDYFGFIAVGAIFALVLLIVSFFLINFLFVNKKDEPTIFEKFGSKHNLRLGPHRLDSIKKIQERKAMIEKEEREAAEERLKKQKGTSETQKPIIPTVEIEAASTS
ncbi:hypothetical protein FO519_007651 [Halicephalobus sp. NKZ332]|nr:hypothetical protein FO519_007651 [Halicephalobus sp. NKZ332]